MNWLKALVSRKRSRPIQGSIQARRIPRSDHPISRAQFTPGTLRTLYGLKDAGYEAYVVGGGVRDFLAGQVPKDFDVATNAHPDEIRRIFRSCRLVGRRFMIAHVRWGQEVVEVTTFRGAITDEHVRDETGRILADNQYGTLETDAFRRDFTVNALYYDIRDYSIVDFTGGLEDLQRRLIRLIGDPETRYREDPVRMLRAVRIANKLGFAIERETAAPIPKLAVLLREIPPARLFDEVIKLLQCREALLNLDDLHRYGLLAHLLPVTDAALAHEPYARFIRAALANTAERIASDQSVSPAFLYATLLWPGVVPEYRRLTSVEGQHPNVAIVQAGETVLAQTQQHIVIPKRFSLPMREIWHLQPRFADARIGRAKRLLAHPRFRAAYDFLLLRAAAGEVPQALADWWTQAQAGSLPPGPPPVNTQDAQASAASAPRKRRRRRRGRGRGAGMPAEPPAE